jgi:signal transduction histidine kinase
MAARASVVGGSVAVSTGPAGTTVRAQLPIGGRGATVA